MAIQHRNYALLLWRDYPGLTNTDKLVLYTIADHCTETDQCRLSASQIAQQVNCGLTAVCGAVKRLADLSVLSRTPGTPTAPAGYTMPIPAWFNWKDNPHRMAKRYSVRLTEEWGEDWDE